MKKLAVRRVAQIVIHVPMCFMEREGPHHNRQRFQRLKAVGRPALARDHTLHIALDGQRDNNAQKVFVRSNLYRILERDGLAMSRRATTWAGQTGLSIQMNGFSARREQDRIAFCAKGDSLI